MFLVLHESVFSVPIISRTVCVTVSRGNKILTDGLFVNVISTSSLRESLENTDLVLADDDTVVLKCATTENGKQYDADLSNTVEQLLEFGRKYISFSVTTVTRAEVPALKQLAPIFTQQARRDCLPPEHSPVQSCIQYVHVHDIVMYNHVLQYNYKSEGRRRARNESVIKKSNRPTPCGGP